MGLQEQTEHGGKPGPPCSSTSLTSKPENQGECFSLRASFQGVLGDGSAAPPHPAAVVGHGQALRSEVPLGDPEASLG